jgi:uncharacterized protein YqeY
MLKKIKDDLKIAIKNKDVKKELLRVLIGEINTVQGRSTTELTDSDIIKIIKKMVNNAKLIMANHEVKILEEYLPKMMSNDEIDKAIADHFCKWIFINGRYG